MELYTSIESATHILQPLAYNQIKKIRKFGAPVHSAQEQFEIHTIAYEYESNLLKIPKPHRVDGRGYIMDMLYILKAYIPHHKYCRFPELVVELVQFMNYMYRHGYWLNGFSIYQTIDNRFVLLDFSTFGHCQGQRVKFPKDPRIYSIEEANIYFGIRMCGCGEQLMPPPSTPVLGPIHTTALVEVFDLDSPRGSPTNTPHIFDMDEFWEYVHS